MKFTLARYYIKTGMPRKRKDRQISQTLARYRVAAEVAGCFCTVSRPALSWTTKADSWLRHQGSQIRKRSNFFS